MDSCLRRNLSCSLAACTTSNENVCGEEAGNHKGCPYSGFAGTYFHTNRSCRLSPAPISTKMGADRRRGNHKGCPYDRFARAYFHTIDRESGGIIATASFCLPCQPVKGEGINRALICSMNLWHRTLVTAAV